MDLQLFARVLWRFKVVTLAGLLCAVTLAALSFVRVSFAAGVASPAISYRQSEQWVSYATILVTQEGLPYGRSVFPAGSTPTGTATAPQTSSSQGPQFADPSRFSSLAILYSQLADSDSVRAILKKLGGGNGKIEAAPILASQGGTDALPLISIAAISPTPAAAEKLARTEAEALESYVRTQLEAGVPVSERVILELVKRPDGAKLLKGRSISLPIVIFLAFAIATCGLAFVLENLSPRVRPLPKKIIANAPDAADAGALKRQLRA